MQVIVHYQDLVRDRVANVPAAIILALRMINVWLQVDVNG